LGTGGELYISKEASSPVLRDAFFSAAKEHNLQLRDFNNDFAKGTFTCSAINFVHLNFITMILYFPQDLVHRTS